MATTKNLGIVSPVPMGTFSTSTAYKKLNIVKYNGVPYIVKKACTGITPAVTSGWEDYYMELVGDGTSIASIALTSTSGLVDTYTITLTNGETYNFTVTNGEDGSDGINTVGFSSASVTTVPTVGNSVSLALSLFPDTPNVGDYAAGVLSATVDGDVTYYLCMLKITAVGSTVTGTYQAACAIQTVQGATVVNNTYEIDSATASASTLTAGSSATASVTASDGTLNFTFGIPKGEKGDTGAQGEKGDTGDTGATGVGISNIAKTGTVDLVDTYTITLTDGSTYNFTVTNGEDGADGTAATATATVETDSDGDTVLVLSGVTASTTTDSDGNTVLVLS